MIASAASNASRKSGGATRSIGESEWNPSFCRSCRPSIQSRSRQADGADVVEYVGRHPQAIGYVSAAYAAAPDSGVRMVPVEDKVPTVANVLSQEYWLIQPLFLATEGQPTGRVRQFIDFALSGPGQEIVARYHAPVR